MDHKYLAENDGSEHAAGRGSGKERPLDMDEIRFGRNQIPWLNMTYAPVERRLDMAVWRALFASSARQARQFCTHGMVKVNGQVVSTAKWRVWTEQANRYIDAICWISSKSRRYVSSRAR